MCNDYRTLNSKTIPDQYITPGIDDALDCLSGSRWFSILDLRSRYYQIAMTEEDKEKMAFIYPRFRCITVTAHFQDYKAQSIHRGTASKD